MFLTYIWNKSNQYYFIDISEMDGIQMKRVTCKKEGCKRILEEESDLKRTLKEKCT